ncbi:type I DNA topoisomerase [Cellulomonas fimi]|uniref:DNA topoisomerase 1 n=1 Tax=Cellulomonas fimi (strain ATCC 484 / DSM 20113 / JCM 1341 / CCUG 24087 / LMG 16345 / NBRC 15513 / NCIMB 8980 / NCTC 7547 / NRS-133) TaxID=590998 RepID=F4H863_CELFA|nr:type I DNA topoisomerase [Cellulomonas fimi]AEE44620.1 DNA topoisomerase I [Cellulomonas fimi ATCC 484]NNH08781.1 type I DNA topoisomerase [Cellulomonas fimi]VEH26804.1 DNA topoisomerase 1 [Cellulomonas fimi]
MSSGRKLVIVESPAKARTIAGYLGEGYDVEASVGHIRDLPQPSELPADMKKGPFGKFAVDVDNGFVPYYVVDPDKRKKVSELKKLLKDSDELYLATDEDREGEAIAWHLLQELKPKVPVKRMVFHEITREAIQRALQSTRDLDDRLVDAQETRRILDRLYGYEVSPVLWRKVRQGLSAGRVQSVATRLVVERERERMAFVPADYWDVTGTFAVEDATQPAFSARLTGLGGRRVASGRDFDDRGRLRSAEAVQLDEAGAHALVAGLDDAAFAVRSLETKPYTRRPAAPFTTSTLQQEASRKLRMSSRQTMRTAQTLYENGYITYMRTDSPALSSQAIDAARRQASELYGPEYVPDAARVYTSKAKGAQEAHEAIRPAGDHFRTPAQVAREITGDQFRLYELIWKRTVASQMADARGQTASVRIAATATPTGATSVGDAPVEAVFSASGTVITFRGFLAAYEEGRDVSRYEDDAAEGAAAEKGEARLPTMAEGDPLGARDLAADGHRTSPPPRYTEASLVKALEERGIGRPSTYAATISVILDRGYVTARGQALVPSWLAFAVTRLLEENFDRLVDYDFTASMEEDLDLIASGEKERSDWLAQFYFGDPALPGEGEGLRDLVANLGEIDAREVNSIEIGDGITLRVGRYGPYLEDANALGEDGNPRRASVPEDLAPDELTVEKARELLETQPEGDLVLGEDPSTGTTIVAKNGRYGPYVTELLPEPELDPALSAAARKKALAAAPKPRTASLFKSMSLQTITIDDALRLLSLPRVVGVDPESGAEITAQNGRYGPYLKKGTDSRTLASEEALFTTTLEEALAIYAQPKRGRGATATPPLRELGDDPTSGKPIVVKDGRFGAYVTDGETNRTLPRDVTPETITPEQAVTLLAEKRAQGPAKKKAPARRTATRSKAATKK